MNNKKNILLVGILASIFVFGCVYTAHASVGRVFINTKSVINKEDKNGNIYTFYSTPAITVIQPKKFSFIFNNQGTTVRNVIRDNNCSAAINGTYFGYNTDRTFFPAGIWYAFGSFISPVYNPSIDPNLKVLLSSDGNKIIFSDNDIFDFSGVFSGVPERSWYLNTGPWLVRDGKINHDVVDKISHRQRKTTRSGIITNPDGTVYFIVSTQDISLPQFITFAYVSGIGTGSFQFVNIDGGASSSLQTPFNSYKSSRKLPIFICIH